MNLCKSLSTGSLFCKAGLVVLITIVDHIECEHFNVNNDDVYLASTLDPRFNKKLDKTRLAWTLAFILSFAIIPLLIAYLCSQSTRSLHEQSRQLSLKMQNEAAQNQSSNLRFVAPTELPFVGHADNREGREKSSSDVELAMPISPADGECTLLGWKMYHVLSFSPLNHSQVARRWCFGIGNGRASSPIIIDHLFCTGTEKRWR